MDVPDPDSADVQSFAATVTLDGGTDDANAARWTENHGSDGCSGVEGRWSSRWNGGPDPTIAGDTVERWKQGQAEARRIDDRVYLMFDRDDGRRKALIEAQRVRSARPVGKYINLTSPAITRPWIGLIGNDRRIDGRFSGCRLDFRR